MTRHAKLKRRPLPCQGGPHRRRTQIGLPDVVDFDSPTGKAILNSAERMARTMTPRSAMSAEQLVGAITQPGAMVAAAAAVQRASDDPAVIEKLAQVVGKPTNTATA
jgi:hypothetical protein